MECPWKQYSYALPEMKEFVLIDFYPYASTNIPDVFITNTPGQPQFQAHKDVLSLCSPVMKSIFEGDTEATEIVLKDISRNTLRYLMNDIIYKPLGYPDEFFPDENILEELFLLIAKWDFRYVNTWFWNSYRSKMVLLGNYDTYMRLKEKATELHLDYEEEIMEMALRRRDLNLEDWDKCFLEKYIILGIDEEDFILDEGYEEDCKSHIHCYWEDDNSERLNRVIEESKKRGETEFVMELKEKYAEYAK